MQNSEKKLASWIILFSLALIWGSSFILMKRGIEVFTWQQVASLRMVIASLFLLPFLLWNFKRVHLRYWKTFFIVGLIGNFIPAFLFTKAETGLSSSLTGMLNSLTPLFTLIVGVLLFKAKTKWINILGVLLGLLGALGLIGAGDNSLFMKSFGYAAYVIIATICYALSVNIIREKLSEINSVVITAWAFCLTGPFAAIYLFNTDFLSKITGPIAIKGLGFIAILAILGSALSVMLFNMLIKQTNALFASSVTYLIPVVAVFWGILDQEHLNFYHFMWILLILTGIYLVNKKTA